MIFMNYYRVSIPNITGAAPNDGFIDNAKPFEYITRNDDGSLSGFSTTDDLALAKVRAYIRYTKILQQIEQVMNVYDVVDVIKTGADENTEASTFEMTLIFDREMDFMVTEDENNPGTMLTGIDAIKRFISRALSSTYQEKIAYPNPTKNTSGIAYGPETISIEVGPIGGDTLTAVEASVTVTEVDLTYPQTYNYVSP